MARVCVGCGLTVNTDGILVVDTVGAWPFACDQEDFGNGVYCSPIDGALRVAPPVRARGANSQGGIDFGGELDIEPGDGQVTIDTIDVTIPNPSTCHSARVFLHYTGGVDMFLPEGVKYNQFIGGGTVGAIFGTPRLFSASNPDNSGTSGSMSDIQDQSAQGVVFTLAPGASLNFSVAIKVSVFGGTASFDRVYWQTSYLIVATQ